MASLVFVILNEVKNLAHPTDKILRCAQDDKQGAGKDGFARRIGSTTRISLVEVSGASNHALQSHTMEQAASCLGPGSLRSMKLDI